MHKTALYSTLLALVVGSAPAALAQGVPTTQPKFLHIACEQLKAGRAAEPAKWEAGWPAAYEKAKFPTTTSPWCPSRARLKSRTSARSLRRRRTER